MMKGWILINPVLDPKSIKRSWVHHSSCGEVLEIVPSNEFQPFGPPPLAVSLRRSRHCLLHSPNSPLGFWTSVCETCSSSAHNDVHSPSCGLCSCTSHCLDGMANKPSRAAAPQTAAPKTPSSSRPFPDSLHVGASGRLSMLLHQGNASINCKFKCLPDVLETGRRLAAPYAVHCMQVGLLELSPKLDQPGWASPGSERDENVSEVVKTVAGTAQRRPSDLAGAQKDASPWSGTCIW